jgi:membrane protein implicated in regulation of membrane protease activity
VFLLVAIVLLILLPSPWNIVGSLISLGLFGGELLFWNRRVRGQHAQTGVVTIVGETGTVLSPCHPNGQVRIDGEIWEARCDEGADRGDPVVVVAVEGLLLVVAPLLEKDGRSAQSSSTAKD